jgi:group I intron endonuclease
MAKRKDSTKSGIYTITAPSGKQYVGSAVNFVGRWHKHRLLLRKGIHNNSRLQAAANKYGVEKLVFSKLLVCRLEDLVMFEQRAIDILKPRYNLCPTAGSFLGYVHTDKTRAKMVETRAKPEVRAKMGKAIGEALGRPEARARASATAIAAWNRPGVRERAIEAFNRPESVAKRSGENNSSKRPEVREKLREAQNKPEVLVRKRDVMLGENNPMTDPEIRKKQNEAVRSLEVRARTGAGTREALKKRPDLIEKRRLSFLLDNPMKRPEVSAKSRATRLANREREFRLHASTYGI